MCHLLILLPSQVTSVRNTNYCDMIVFVYTTHTHTRGMSRIIASDPDFDQLLIREGDGVAQILGRVCSTAEYVHHL